MALPIPSKKLRDYSKYNKDGLRILLQNRHITVFDNATSYELMAVVCLYECGLLATGITIEDNYLTRFPILKEASAWWKGTKSEVVKVADQRRIGSGGYKYQVIERLLLALNMGNSTSSAPSQELPNNGPQEISGGASTNLSSAFQNTTNLSTGAGSVTRSPTPGAPQSVTQGILHSPMDGILRIPENRPMDSPMDSPMQGITHGHARELSNSLIQEPRSTSSNRVSSGYGMGFSDFVRRRLDNASQETSSGGTTQPSGTSIQRMTNGAQRLQPFDASSSLVSEGPGPILRDTSQSEPDRFFQERVNGTTAVGSNDMQGLHNSTAGRVLDAIAQRSENINAIEVLNNASHDSTASRSQRIFEQRSNGTIQQPLTDTFQVAPNNSDREILGHHAHAPTTSAGHNTFGLNATNPEMPGGDTNRSRRSDRAVNVLPNANHTSFLVTAKAISEATNTIVTKLASSKVQLDRDLKSWDDADRALLTKKDKYDEHFQAWQVSSEEYRGCIQGVSQLQIQVARSLEAYISVLNG